MTPRLPSINVSPGSIPKRPVVKAEVSFTRTLGDNWRDRKRRGLPGQAICLLSLKPIEELQQLRYPLFPGALGENFNTRLLDSRAVQIGQTYRVGNHVVIRITKVWRPGRTIPVYGKAFFAEMSDTDIPQGVVPSPTGGRSGFYSELLQEGAVFPGDPTILNQAAMPSQRIRTER